MCSGQAGGMIAGATIGAMNSGMAAYAQMQQAKQDQKVLNRQAKIERQKALEVRNQAADLAIEQGELRRQRIGSGLAIAAANGVALNASTIDAASLWEQDQEALGAYERDKIQRDAELQAWGFLSNSDMLRWQGRVGIRVARRAAWASAIMGGQSAQGAAQGSSLGSSISSSYSSGGAN